jgi:hypothetical protein
MCNSAILLKARSRALLGGPVTGSQTGTANIDEESQDEHLVTVSFPKHARSLELISGACTIAAPPQANGGAMFACKSSHTANLHVHRVT